MKKLSLLAFFVLLTIPSYAWKPIFVGHRGSYRGVANTAEAFRNGVNNYGYTGLECDVRVTSDGEYVIMHDETTTSLGGSLTVATSTLAELKAETLTQTRSSVTYTGEICTVAEYLDICIEKGAFPVIELKWTTGINNNDMSNFPGLMDLVIEKGILEEAIFLTSMQTSIEYIRTNYPTATCQFLTGEYWENHFDWCVEWNVMPSIESGNFDIYTVQKFRNVGLDVAMWTVNTETNYLTYGNAGVCMMTCDYLYANEMPELEDINWDEIPVRYDPIEIETELLWSYRDRDDNLPYNFPSGTSEIYNSAYQATVVDEIFYTNNYTTSKLLAIKKDGTITESTGSNSPGITRDDAGNLILRNDGITETPNSILIYPRGETSNPTELNFTLLKNGQADYITASGDIFSADGGYIYIYPNGEKYVNFIKIANGAIESVTISDELSVAATTSSLVTPIDNDPNNFIYEVPSNGYYRYKDETNAADYLTTGAVTRAPARNLTLGGALLILDEHEILVHTSGTNYNGGFTIKDMTADSETLKNIDTVGSNGVTGNPSLATFFTAVKETEARYTLYAYTMGNGYAAYEIALLGASVDKDIIANQSSIITTYPNPATNNITINYNEGINQIALFTINGNKIIETIYTGENIATIDIESLPKGIYILKINNSTATRIIKE